MSVLCIYETGATFCFLTKHFFSTFKFQSPRQGLLILVEPSSALKRNSSAAFIRVYNFFCFSRNRGLTISAVHRLTNLLFASVLLFPSSVHRLPNFRSNGIGIAGNNAGESNYCSCGACNYLAVYYVCKNEECRKNRI